VFEWTDDSVCRLVEGLWRLYNYGDCDDIDNIQGATCDGPPEETPPALASPYTDDDGNVWVWSITEIYEDKYDSLVYITDINYNDLNGFTFTDTNENGQWDNGEPSTLDNEIYTEYYFDQTELELKDSTYSSVDTLFSHTFNFDKWVLASDSLIFKVSTDCNDNGQWDGAETTTESECNNGFWNEEDLYCDIGNGVQDPDEPYIDLELHFQYHNINPLHSKIHYYTLIQW
jgi:hypothetical protein